MLNLITGTPGAGKTLYAVSLIKKYVDENAKRIAKGEPPRKIYSDIDGLTLDGVEPAPEDWRTTPDHSVIFYDEIQQRKPFKESRASNDIVDALQVHRHTGHDIYGITQFPVLLHSHFRSVVGSHYHLHRGWGMPSATVYLWGYCVLNPNDQSKKRIAERDFRFSYPKDLYKYYKSASVHTHKMRIPLKAFLYLLLILVGIVMFVANLNGNNFVVKIFSGHKDQSQQIKTDLSKNNAVTTNSTDLKPIVNPDKKEDTIKYNANQPFDYDYNNYEKEQAQYPQFSGCIFTYVKHAEKCTCYTTQGVKLTTPKGQCMRVIDGDMPFNPFTQPHSDYPQSLSSIQQQPVPQDIQSINRGVIIGRQNTQLEEAQKSQDWNAIKSAVKLSPQ